MARKLVSGVCGARSRSRGGAAAAGSLDAGGQFETAGAEGLGSFATDGANKFKFADDHVTNKKRDEVNAALEAAYYEKDMMTTPYNPVVVNTGSKQGITAPPGNTARDQPVPGTSYQTKKLRM